MTFHLFWSFIADWVSCGPRLTSWGTSVLSYITEVGLGHKGNYRPVLSSANQGGTNTLSWSPDDTEASAGGLDVFHTCSSRGGSGGVWFVIY